MWRVPVSGGDPAADSPTATLLRLKPPCEAQIRLSMIASSGPHSGALTGGVCKEQGRIHRALVTRDYYRIQLHVGELQPTIRTTIEFLRLPSPFGVGTLCLDHCSPRVAQHIRGILTYRCPFLPPCWPRQSRYCPQPLHSVAGKYRCGSRSLPDLTGRLTVRADGGHAPPLYSVVMRSSTWSSSL